MILFHSHNHSRCRELWAVLDAAGISASIDERGGTCFLHIAEADLERAVEELNDYRQELSQVRKEPPPLVALPGGWLGMLGYGAILVTVAGLADSDAFGIDWLAAGSAQAGSMLNGQAWRAVTALTLHLDAAHLMGNLFFGSVLGFLGSQGLGGGLAWLAIVAGGSLGNLVNAWIRTADHSAVGASTSVFAALGLLVALSLHQRRGEAAGAFRRWSPLVAGVLLLAWTGIGGERTDVLAHVTGLASGVLLGASCGFLPIALLERRAVQGLAAAGAVLIPTLAWVWALLSS